MCRGGTCCSDRCWPDNHVPHIATHNPTGPRTRRQPSFLQEGMKMAEKHEKEQKSRDIESAGKGAGEAMGRAARESVETAQQGVRSAEATGRWVSEGVGAVASRGI